MSHLLGRTDDAISYLRAFITSGKVHQSTMYSEGGSPCIESPLAAANALQEVLLDTWGGRQRIFNGLSATLWPDAVFHRLLAEGGFEVSARRRNGTTVFVQVRALGHQTTFVADTDMTRGTLQVQPATVHMTTHPNGTFVLTQLPRGTVAIVSVIGTPNSDLTVAALPGNSAEFNYWGTNSTAKLN